MLRVSTLEDAGPDDLSFLATPSYRRAAESTRAGALLVPVGCALSGRDLIEVADPYVALAEVLALFHPPSARRAGVAPEACISETARLGIDVQIGPHVVVEAGVEIGDRAVLGAGCFLGEGACVGEDSVLAPRVVLYPGTRIGSRCLIHAGAVLGADGFGFVSVAGRHRKIPQVGRVVVEDDVEIGANSTIDRAAIGETVIGSGSKIDDLVMVAHGVRTGPDCLLVAQSGIAGSTRLGRGVTFAGQAGAAGHLEIGDRSVIAAKSAVFTDLPAGSFVAGIPAVDHRLWKRRTALVGRLETLRNEVRDLAAKIAALEQRMHEKET